MLKLNLKSAFNNETEMRIKHKSVFFGLFLMYMIIRIVAWQRTIVLENHDSVEYLKHIKLFLDFDFQGLLNMSPDATPFYPFFSAICSLPGWSVETGARLCSLLFSLVLFFSLMVIGKRLTDEISTAIGLFFLCFSPALILLSFAVLSEPTYVAIVYFGFWLFLTQYKLPSLWNGAILGIIYGLSFLCRTEGFLFIAAIPILQGFHFLFAKRKNYGFKRLMGWTLIFIISFSILAIPQIWFVSKKMGRFAINGRVAWMAIWNNPDGKSKAQKIYGLDYSPSQINLHYIQSHPEIVGQFQSNKNFKYYIRLFRKIVVSFQNIFQNRLGVLIGPIGIFLFLLGLLSLFRSRRGFESFLILLFLGFVLFPVLLAKPSIRHISVIIPIILLTEGIGATYLYDEILSRAHYSRLLIIIVIISTFALHLISNSAIPLFVGLNKPSTFNSEYNPYDLREPIKIIKQITQSELHRPPIILSRKSYLPYFSEGKWVILPYTTYQGLVDYCHLHNVDFFFIQHRLLRGSYPFLPEFRNENTSPEFNLIYSAKDFYGERIGLYRFLKKKNIDIH